jgi:hypothetical protein
MSVSDSSHGREAPRESNIELIMRCWEETTPRERRRLLRSAILESTDAHPREQIPQSPSDNRPGQETTRRERLRLALSRAEELRDLLAERLAQCQWSVELFRRADSDAYEPPDDQIARDAFILESYRQGKKLSVIRSLVRSRPDWRTLGTDSAVRHALIRYCQRLGIKPPTRK